MFKHIFILYLNFTSNQHTGCYFKMNYSYLIKANDMSLTNPPYSPLYRLDKYLLHTWKLMPYIFAYPFNGIGYLTSSEVGFKNSIQVQ
jgi:hypothetical protein